MLGEWIIQNLGPLIAVGSMIAAVVVQHHLTRWRVSLLEASRGEFRKDVKEEIEELRHELDRECDNLIRRLEGGERDSRRAWGDGLQRLSSIEAKIEGLDRRLDMLERRWQSRDP